MGGYTLGPQVTPGLLVSATICNERFSGTQYECRPKGTGFSLIHLFQFLLNTLATGSIA